MTQEKKKKFLARNLEHLKAGVAIGFSLSGISVVIAGIVLHIINPAMGFITIPLALQALLVAVIKKAPKTIELLKATVKDILKDEDQQKVNGFVDDIISTYSQNTAHNTCNEPIADHPIDSVGKDVVQNAKVPMNAYYFPAEDRYEISPRLTK